MSVKGVVLHKKAGRKAHKDHSAWLQQNWQRVLEWAGAGLVVLGILSCIAQLLYPSGRALPLFTIGGLEVGGKDQQAITAELNEYAQKGKVKIATPNKQWEAHWQSIGINIDSQASADVAVNYPLWERFIPFSSVIKIVQSRQMPLVGITDQERLDAFAKKIVKEERLAAVNAKIRVTDGKVALDEAKSGYHYTADAVKQQIQALAINSSSVLNLKPEQENYDRSIEQLQDVKKHAEAAIARSIKLTVANKTYTPSAKLKGQWLKFSEDPKTKAVKMATDSSAIKKYLETINKDISVDPGTITVTLLDGQEINRTSAAQGRSVAVGTSIKQIESALLGKVDQTVPLTVANVPPRINYVRTYSSNSSGLQAILQEWEAAHYGDFGVVIREVGGQGRYAQWQPDKQFVTASTFKLFVYYAVAKKIEAGQISYGQQTDMGWTVEACLHEMIINSTNPCAISLLNLVGWQTAQDMTTAAGFSGTFINNQGGGDKFSTVRDETNYMMRLNAGTLMGSEPTARLLGYLKRQVWRAGIPSGIPYGVTVANKVGFYNSWVHDIAIVYGPKSTFILGIMSKGGSDPSFAELARRVYAFFNG